MEKTFYISKSVMSEIRRNYAFECERIDRRYRLYERTTSAFFVVITLVAIMGV